MDRRADLIRFYEILGTLEKKVGGKRTLAECDGRMPWPRRGVYFFFEPGEVRSDSGGGPRVVRVGTHALANGSTTTLWRRLSQHRGSKRSGGGNHRGSIFRLLVGTRPQPTGSAPRPRVLGRWQQPRQRGGGTRSPSGATAEERAPARTGGQRAYSVHAVSLACHARRAET